MLSLEERAQRVKQYQGMSVSEVFNHKKELVAKYADMTKEIFGNELSKENNREDYNSLLYMVCVDMEKELVDKLNSRVKESGKDFTLTTLNRPAVEQVCEFYIEKQVNDIMDFIKSLCSEEEFKAIKEEIDAGLDKDDMFNDMDISNEVPLIEQVDLLANELNKIVEETKIQLKSQFELEKDVKENSEAGEQAAKEFKDSANFTPNMTSEKHPIDVEFKEVSSKEEQEKKELLDMIEDCTNYYYNINRVTSMIGGQTAILKNVMDNILVYCNNMNKLVEDSFGKESTQEIKTKLSNMQIELAKMICAYNPNNNNNDINTIFKSFKTIQVDGDGKPVLYEDFFGNTINADDIKPNNTNTQPNNTKVSSELLVKYPEIIPLMRKISQMGIEVSLSEINTKYKNNPSVSVVKADLSMNGKDLKKSLIIDTKGVLFNDINKVIIIPESNIVEDGIVLDLNNESIIQKYIYGNISNEELLKHDIVDNDLRIMSRIVDLSSMNSEQRTAILNVLLQKPSKVVLNDAVEYDEDVRFKLSKWTDIDNFELISNSTVKSSFLGTSCKRKKQILRFVKGNLAIGR